MTRIDRILRASALALGSAGPRPGAVDSKTVILQRAFGRLSSTAARLPGELPRLVRVAVRLGWVVVVGAWASFAWAPLLERARERDEREARLAPEFFGSRRIQGRVGQRFRFQLQVSWSGGSPVPDMSVVEGEAPPGLMWDTATRVLSGDPLRAGGWSLTLRASRAGRAAQATFVFVIAA